MTYSIFFSDGEGIDNPPYIILDMPRLPEGSRLIKKKNHYLNWILTISHYPAETKSV